MMVFRPNVLYSGMLALVLLLATGANEIAAAESGEERFLSKTRRLTYQGKRAGEGYFSPDGRLLIFQSEREPKNPFYQIYMLDLESGDTHRVSPGVGKTTCAFFRPNSEEVLFASSHLDPDAAKKQQEEIDFRASGKERRYSWDYDDQYDVFSTKRDGSNIRRLTNTPGYDAEAGYSPDGSQIVFCSFRDAYPLDKLSAEDRKRMETDPAYFGEIYIMNADGSEPRRLTDWPGYDGGPFFSPDGRRILWRHFDESGMIADVYTMALDGSDRRQLTDFESMSWAPYFHPSGEYVIFTTNKLGFSNFELYIVDASGGGEPVRVTHTDGFDGLPVFSPDGRRVAWTSGRTSSKQSQLFLADWNHQAALEALNLSAQKLERMETSGARAGATKEKLQATVAYLADDEREGRMTGSKGARMAGEYIADRMKDIGLKPLGDGRGYFQKFPFTASVKIVKDENRFNVSRTGESGKEEKRFEIDKDFRPMGFTENVEVEGPVVFAGYGLNVPGDERTQYDSYGDLDVKDKVVMVLRYVPEDVTTERRMELNRYALIRYKAMRARELGAKALLVVTGPNSPNAGELIPLKFDQSSASSGIAVASITGEVASAILAGSGKDLGEVQTGLDTENPHFNGTFDVPDVRVRIKTSVAKKKKDGRNVIGVIPPTGGAGEAEYVVIGAHYDHIGSGEIGSLARKGEEGQIHNGADDNASGTAVVLELAEALATAKATSPDMFRRGVIVALWSGEELGTIGSSYFVGNPPVAIEGMTAYLNFDMVGQLRENRLTLQGVGSSDLWPELIEKRNIAAGFDVAIQEDPYLPTDVSSFYPKKVPVVSFFTGSHDNYNRPTDDWDTLNYEGMVRVTDFALAILTNLISRDDRPQYVRVEQKSGSRGARSSLRAYLGTIPDYASDGIEGVKLSGVRAGGPADKAGIQGGDIIVKFAGQTITNIYDYTYALEAVKIGKAVEVVVLRDDKLFTMTVIPEARK